MILRDDKLLSFAQEKLMERKATNGLGDDDG